MKRKYLILMGLLMALLGACAGDGVKNMNVDAFEKAIAEEEKLQLIDVRTQDEFFGGHIPNSISIDVSTGFFMQKAEAYLDINQKVYVYCKSGARSMEAAQMLKEKGYQVVNLKGGFDEWKAKGKPIE